MIRRILTAIAPLALIGCAPILEQRAPVAAVTPEQMRRHIEILASDEYEGRKPGTAGETKTIAYISQHFQRLGLEPAAGTGSWYQPVPLVRREASTHRASFSRNGQPVAFGADDIVLVGNQPEVKLANAPVWFVGNGGESDIAGARLDGGIALVAFSPDFSTNFEARAAALAAAGAAAVIIILPENVPWPAIQKAFRTGRDQLQRNDLPRIQGAMPRTSAGKLLDAAQLSVASGAGFRAVRLDVRANLDVTSRVHSYTSNNVIGRLKGSGTTGESVLYLGHWDHLGICAPEGAADRICNGAVDNASGIAMLIEIAGNIARGKRPERDILFMGTTAEEVGLLGAEYFGAHPTVPLNSIVAAINIDTVAIHRKGEPVAIIGKGTEPLDRLIAQTAAELGRRMDNDAEADEFVTRQDGWVLTRAGVPTVMVGGSFSNMKQLGAFLSGPYHKPSDDLARELILDGAAEDTELLIALGRKLADPKHYQPPRR